MFWLKNINTNILNSKLSDDMADSILFLENINVSFDGFKALNNLTLAVKTGELRCIIGANGAGKTTMMDVITGKTRPDSGRACFAQRFDLTKMTEFEIAHAGIGRKFQKPTVFPGHSVLENLELAMHANKGVFSSLFAKLSSRQLENIESVLEIIGLVDQRYQLAGYLAHGEKQWLEIGMLLMQDPKVLLVDEPVAGMTQQESERTASLLCSLAGKHSVVVVEHDMEFIRSIANTVTVLHEGGVLAEGDMASIQSNAQVIEVYLGE